jgi:twitching motility protein PilT
LVFTGLKDRPAGTQRLRDPLEDVMKTAAVHGPAIEQVMAATRGSSLFKSLDDNQLRQAVSQANLIQLETGESLIRQGEPPGGFYLVLQGELRVLMGTDADGDCVEVTRFGRGEMLGVASLLLARPSEATLEAVERSTIACFEPRFFEVMIGQVPSFGLEVARSLAERLAQVVARVPVPEADPTLEPPSEALGLLPHEFMMRHRVVPLAVDGQTATIGCADQPSAELVERIRTHLPAMEVRVVHLDSRRLAEILRSRSGGDEPVEAGPAPESAMLERLLRAMATEGASDLHLCGGQRPRWRIDGAIREIADIPPLGPETVLELLGDALEDRNRQEYEATNDTDFALELSGVARFRVNLFRDLGGVGAVFRLIPSTILSLEQLGMPAVVADFCEIPKGLVLVTGPTGSGKSTTLAAMVDLINRGRKEHVITLEDPVEFVHPSQLSLVNQREVGSHTTSFAAAIRAALREDPDIILVGEMRDLETVSLALEAANTGHLVLGTLHTATAISTIERIVGLFPSQEQSRIQVTLADVVRGIVTQNLLQRIGGGRVAALEILVASPAISNLIREGKTHQIASSMQTGKAAGNQLLNESLAALVTRKIVEYEEALSKAVDKADLAKRLGRGVV